MLKPIPHRIAAELAVRPAQIEAAIALLDEGATVPFIARYRKEATGELSDTHLRHLEERLRVLRDLEERRATVLNSIREQGKLTPELEQALLTAETRTRLEDLYLPYRPKRRTKAAIAREAGLEPLARGLWKDPGHDPLALAAGFVDPEKGVADPAAALEGARSILIELFSEDAELLGQLRETLWSQGMLNSRVVPGKETSGVKFSDYFANGEPLARIPAHRALALLRGVSEGVLRLSLDHPQDEGVARDHSGVCERLIAARMGVREQGRPADRWLLETVHHTWRKKLREQLEGELLKRLTAAAHAEAVAVFGNNLRDLLLAAPAGMVAVIGLDPGLRTGVKVAVVDPTGKLVETGVIHPHPPHNRWREARDGLAALVRRHQARLISIGNGTASRETERLVTELKAAHPELGVTGVVVSEAGASVYSASEHAAREFPQLDVSLRGAVSIARRLQDPLAELVKVDPAAIGVGQYQHDVDPQRLAATLNGVVEDAVNAVGVEVNTASIPLLERVSGLNQTLARNLVEFRDQHGPFRNRNELRKVPRFGPKTFELAAGFLRIRNGESALDNSAVHPEAYPVVERIVRATGAGIDKLIGNRQLLAGLAPERFQDERFGLPTVRDILHELEKPGRDPRPEFKTAAFRADVTAMEHLVPGMVLEGTVTNVTNFGAFVDIGVHQDGLVHISALADQFVRDPRAVVKVGEVVKVRVVEVDQPRKRIALSMRLTEGSGEASPRREERTAAAGGTRAGGGSSGGGAGKVDSAKGGAARKTSAAPAPAAELGALAEALARAGIKR